MEKQIIIIRKDLKNKKGEKIRTGKYVSQASHAVLGVILYKVGIDLNKQLVEDLTPSKIEKKSFLHNYLSGIYTKISLAVNSEEELLEIHQKILDAGYASFLVIDEGKTEFDKKTPTCLAVEPLPSELIDPLTKHLSIF